MVRMAHTPIPASYWGVRYGERKTQQWMPMQETEAGAPQARTGKAKARGVLGQVLLAPSRASSLSH